jgi:GMP synthase (glutamine-hydrolysing)
MPSEILIVKNITREGPGLLHEEIQRRGIPFKLVDLGAGEAFPNPDPFAAVVVLGGPDSANDKTPKMREERSQIKRTVELGIPYLGACLGLQTLVKACGGEVYPNDVREIGWRDSQGDLFEIDLTEEGDASPLFSGLNSPLEIFHLHGETVKLTPEMTLLATGKHCRNQAVRVGANAYGLQGHFELNESMFHAWITEDPDLLQLDRAKLVGDYQAIKTEYEATGRRLLNNFLSIAGLA